MSSSIQRSDVEPATDDSRTDDEPTPAVPPHGTAMADLREEPDDDDRFDDRTVPRHGVAMGDRRRHD